MPVSPPEKAISFRETIMPRLHTARLDLVPGSAEHLRADLAGRAALQGALGAEVSAEWPPELYDADAVRYSLEWVLTHPEQSDWGGFYVVLRSSGLDPARLIGICGFKGKPDSTGSVELGYGILPAQQRRGYATEAVLALVDWAFGRPEVSMVVGQTLPHLTASIGVLEKSGFRYAGLGSDPHAPAGEQVIRYELTRDDLTRASGAA
jgi:[ribosomal protein S5]-alanine N-acetyltransferase